MCLHSEWEVTDEAIVAKVTIASSMTKFLTGFENGCVNCQSTLPL